MHHGLLKLVGTSGDHIKLTIVLYVKYQEQFVTSYLVRTRNRFNFTLLNPVTNRLISAEYKIPPKEKNQSTMT